MKHFRNAVIWSVSGVASLAAAYAEDPLWDPSISIGGHLGVRFASSDDDLARVDGGFGKFRFGGDGSGNRDADAQIGEITLELDARLNNVFGVIINAQHQPEQRNAVDLVEAYVFAEPRVTDSLSIIAKGGAFFPGLSKENRGVGWSNTYTLTNSAANTWIAEDIRSFGFTLGAAYFNSAFSASLEGGLFYANDVAGPVLTFGGWSLNDLKTPIFGENQAPILAQGARPATFDPFEELDDRVGFQVRADLNLYGVGGLTAVYWDNRGDINQSQPGEVVWDTRFLGVTGEFTLPLDVSFIPSGMIGEASTPTVQNEFWTISGLVSRYFGPVQSSFRAEYFVQNDQRPNPALDLGENGFALTAAVRYLLTSNHEFLGEIVHQQTDRNSGATAAPIDLQETLIQLGYRFAF